MDNIKYKKLEQKKNRYKFEAEVPEKFFEEQSDSIFSEKAKNVKLPGFRPGKAPKNEIQKEIGYSVYIDAINKCIPAVAVEVLKKENLNPISSLDYQLQEPEKDEKNIKFTFEFLNQPQIDVKKLGGLKIDIKDVTVTDSEVDDVIKNLIKSSLPREKWEKFIIKKTSTSKKVNTESKKSVEKVAEQVESELNEDIELNDELIKELGYEDEKDLSGVRKKVKETLQNLKEEQNQAEFNAKLIEEAIKVADFEIPHEYVHREMEERENAFKKRLSDLKLDVEIYLKTQGKSLDELRQDWHKQSEVDLATDLLLINIAMAEKRIPSDEEVEAEIAKMDDKSKAYYTNPQNKDYLKTALIRNKGLDRLVELNKKDSKKK